MKKTWSVFLAGFLAGVLALGALLALTSTPAAEAQLLEMSHEQPQIMRDMSTSLRGIERALQEIARKP